MQNLEALKGLINLQKERQIVIKACEKGAGIIILDFNEYLRACYQHLKSKISPGNPYYSEVNILDIEKSKTEIQGILKEALEKKYNYLK